MFTDNLKGGDNDMIKRKGFTLIELLVVIAIIGILSAVGLIALNGAREKARDATRKSDLGQIRTGLALYYDTSNAYPDSNGAAGSIFAVLGGQTLITVKAVRADDGGKVLGAPVDGTDPLIYNSLVNTTQKFMGSLPVANAGSLLLANRYYWFISCTAGAASTTPSEFALIAGLERPATTNALWVIVSKSGTAGETTPATTYCQ